MSGFEPPTVRLRIECSTTELHRHRPINIARLLTILQAKGDSQV